MSAQQERLLARLPRSSWVAFALLLVLLSIANIVYQADAGLELGPTTYGRAGNGLGAVYTLLEELGFSVARSRAPYDAVAPDATLWLVQPELGGPTDEELEEALRGRVPDVLTPLQAWIAAGGTAVVIGADASVWRAFGIELKERETTPTRARGGPLLGGGAPLEIASQWAFEESPESEALLRVDGAPFALLRRYGAGHLVAVADAEPFTNGQLAEADHARLAVELARAFGAPLFDERGHGLQSDASLASALGSARLALLAAGFGLLALVALWFARRVPRAALESSPLPNPNLGQFVDALATAYARKGSREASAAFAAYVHGFRQRLRKALYGRGRGSDELLAQRLARDLADDPALLAQLQGEAKVGSTAELERAVRDLERYLGSQLWQSRRQPLRGSPRKGVRS